MKANCASCGTQIVLGMLRCVQCVCAGRTDTTFHDTIEEWEGMKRDGTVAAAEQYAKHLIDNPDEIPGMLERYEKWRRANGR